MTLEQMSNLAGIMQEELYDYVREGLIEDKSHCPDGFADDDVKRISLIRCLLKIGLEKSGIKEYFTYLEKGEPESAVKLLRNARKTLLTCIHEKQKYLDTLDCIIRKTKERGNK